MDASIPSGEGKEGREAVKGKVGSEWRPGRSTEETGEEE